MTRALLALTLAGCFGPDDPPRQQPPDATGDTAVAVPTVDTAPFRPGLDTGIFADRDPIVLTGDYLIPPVYGDATGEVDAWVDPVSGAVALRARLTDVDPAKTFVTLNRGQFGRVTGELEAQLDRVPGTSTWILADFQLGMGGVDVYNAGRLYVEVTTLATPSGILRGWLVPEGMSLIATTLTPDLVSDPAYEPEPGVQANLYMTYDVRTGFAALLMRGVGFVPSAAELRRGGLYEQYPNSAEVVQWSFPPPFEPEAVVLEAYSLTGSLRMGAERGDLVAIAYSEDRPSSQGWGVARGEIPRP